MTQEESAGGPGGVLVALPAATVHLLKSSQVDSGEGGVGDQVFRWSPVSGAGSRSWWRTRWTLGQQILRYS